MAAALAGGGDPLAAVVVLEAPAARAQRRPGIARALRLHALRRLVSRQARQAHRLWRLEQEAKAEFVRGAGPVPDWPKGVDQHHIPENEINRASTAAWLCERAPRLLAVAGSPILGGELLAVPRDGTLNMHSSLLPRYRGTRAEFWQVHNGDLDCAGLTIHYVDTSVDGGDIVRHHPLNPAPGDGPWLMRARNQLGGLTIYPETVRAVLEGRTVRCPQPPVKERVYRYSDITPDATRTVLKILRQARRQQGRVNNGEV
ncbi:formyltransferase family protein [Leisingera sp. XS_AS12]|uniref:formyltransferase family protein n=1 Tax=Leisingera sp. XS_AS12 TaxID=3241294 RepID=UPI003514783C